MAALNGFELWFFLIGQISTGCVFPFPIDPSREKKGGVLHDFF